MDAWETLIAGSTIADGDAWEHLQAQGGGGTESYLILADGLEVSMTTTEIEAEIDDGIEADIDQDDIIAQIDQSTMEVEI